ncbi:hypothetical protein SAMN05720354_12126 [Nitrosospira sp. Nsp1]|nr:hypothetical protein SAMN05720354_12126 [Nitrosospira sp. Nsp1]
MRLATFIQNDTGQYFGRFSKINGVYGSNQISYQWTERSR